MQDILSQQCKYRSNIHFWIMIAHLIPILVQINLKSMALAEPFSCEQESNADPKSSDHVSDACMNFITIELWYKHVFV